MNKAMTKQRIFWTPSLQTAQNIDDADAVCAIEAARRRFTTSKRDLESAFDAKAAELRKSFIEEVNEHVHLGE
jgi:hypothetical protein